MDIIRMKYKRIKILRKRHEDKVEKPWKHLYKKKKSSTVLVYSLQFSHLNVPKITLKIKVILYQKNKKRIICLKYEDCVH